MNCIDCHERPIFTRGRCRSCYGIAAARGEIAIRNHGGASQCSVPDCGAVGLLRLGLCNRHYHRLKRNGTTDDRYPQSCVVAGCEQAGPYRRGMCNLHYTRWMREHKEEKSNGSE